MALAGRMGAVEFVTKLNRYLLHFPLRLGTTEIKPSLIQGGELAWCPILLICLSNVQPLDSRRPEKAERGMTIFLAMIVDVAKRRAAQRRKDLLACAPAVDRRRRL